MCSEAPQSEVVVSIEAAAFGYGRQVVLKDVNLVMRPGDFWFLLGPNGSGKTTLLRGLLGALQPLQGRVRRNADYAAYEHVGFVPQRCEMHPTLPTTVREFVLLGLVGARARRDERARRLEQALERVGLAGMAGQSYWHLSGGQRQRALVARALVRRPRLLILDEPTNGLDLAAEDALLGSIERLNTAEGLTVVFVTHDLALAARYAGHAALFRNGEVVAGKRETTLTSEELTRTYAVPVSVFQQPDGSAAIRVNGGPTAT